MALRDISDDNDEFRDLELRFDGYPYTYPITYATADTRELSDPEEE